MAEGLESSEMVSLRKELVEAQNQISNLLDEVIKQQPLNHKQHNKNAMFLGYNAQGKRSLPESQITS